MVTQALEQEAQTYLVKHQANKKQKPVDESKAHSTLVAMDQAPTVQNPEEAADKQALVVTIVMREDFLRDYSRQRPSASDGQMICIMARTG